MDRKYAILALVLVVLAGGLLLIPDKGADKDLKPAELLLSINDEARFLTTDDVTKRIIEEDPTLQLIDVRKPDEFRTFALRGAVNIPLDSLLSDSWKDVITREAKDKVFYSNDDIAAEKAWMICKRMKVDKIYIMKGGMNEWFETIIKVKEPEQTAPTEAYDRYTFRLAARQFFTGIGAPVPQPAAGATETSKPAGPAQKKAPATIKVEKKEESTGGGC